MNKSHKLILSGIIVIVISFFGYFLYGVFRYDHSLNVKKYKEYMWLFNDSIKNDIDTLFCYSYVFKHDIYTNFKYIRNTNIILWEFKDLRFSELSESKINAHVDFNDIKFSEGEILNKNSDLEINIKNGYDFSSIIQANLDEASDIARNINGDNYYGFYGKINKMLLSNEKKEPQIILTYTAGPSPTLFLFFKGHKGFYLIIINSDAPFDESILKILNLS